MSETPALARPFRAALIQMRSGVDAARNVAALREAVREAAAAGAAYVQTPEMTGAVQRDGAALLAAARPEREDPVVRAASACAAEHGLWLHVGSTAVLDTRPGRLANRAFLFAPDGALRARYDKLHMFDVDLRGGESWRESRLYAAGERAVVARTPLAMIGLGICYDLRFPELFARQARAGASVLTAPAAFTARTGRAHWEVLARARAIECGAWLLAAAQGGVHEDGRETFGRTIAVDPWGGVAGMIDHDAPGVLTVDVDPEASRRARAMVPNLRHARAFGLDVVGREAASGDGVDGSAREAAE